MKWKWKQSFKIIYTSFNLWNLLSTNLWSGCCGGGIKWLLFDHNAYKNLSKKYNSYKKLSKIEVKQVNKIIK